MTSITPDLVKWLVSDPKVSSSWQSIAWHLSLSIHISTLEVSRRNRRTDSQRMKEILIIWRSLKSGTYTVETLLDMLDILVRDGTDLFLIPRRLVERRQLPHVIQPSYSFRVWEACRSGSIWSPKTSSPLSHWIWRVTRKGKESVLIHSLSSTPAHLTLPRMAPPSILPQHTQDLSHLWVMLSTPAWTSPDHLHLQGETSKVQKYTPSSLCKLHLLSSATEHISGGNTLQWTLQASAKLGNSLGAVNHQYKRQDSSKSILQTKYHQGHVNMNTAKHSYTYRHSSYNPVMEVDHGKTLDESLHTVPKQKECLKRKVANNKKCWNWKIF